MKNSIKIIFEFLFGKKPNIFDKNGRVQHHLSDQQWDEWYNLPQTNPSSLWQNHKGTQGLNANQKKSHSA